MPTRALLTDMNSPLGATVGNAIEVAEALDVLGGGGPRDVVELTLRLAGEMLELAGIDARDPAQTLRDGTAMDRFRQLVAAQGGDLSVPLPIGAHSETVTAIPGRHNGRYRRDGSGAGGLAARRGQVPAGRTGAMRRGCPDSPSSRRTGRARCEPLFTLYTDTPERFGAAMAELDGGWSVGDRAPVSRPLIIDRITT